MDGLHLQTQLKEVKQRLASMSMTSQPHPQRMWPGAYAYAPEDRHNLFNEQLEDIKAQLDRMQENLARRQWQMTSGRPRASPYVHRGWGFDTHGGQTPAIFHHSEPWPGPPSSHVAYEPHLARDTDMHHVAEKVAALEQLISNFEDRLDAMDPRRFTPPASDTDSEDISQREGRKDIPQAIEPATASTSTSADTLASASGATASEVILRGVMAALAELGRVNRYQVPETSQVCGIGRCAGGDPHITPPATAPGPAAGLEFRDREIARLDELLSNTAASTKVSEDLLAEKDATIDQLTEELREATTKATTWAETCVDQDGKLEKMARDFHSLRLDLDRANVSRQHFMAKYVDENYRFRWLEQKKLQSENQLQKHIERLENTSREADVRQSLASKSDEIDKQQDARFIARSTRLLEERDDEIHALRRTTQKTASARDFALEDRKRLVSTLKERDAEIEGLKNRLERKDEKQSGLQAMMRKDADGMRSNARTAIADTDEPLARAAHAVKKGHRLPTSSSWMPRSPHRYSRLPHEESRALAWENGYPDHGVHSFGAASPLNPAVRHDDKSDLFNERTSRVDDTLSGFRDCPQDERPRAATPDIYQVRADRKDKSKTNAVQRTGRDAYGSSMEAQPTARKSARRDQHTLPLDATRWPPLPAPVAAAGRVGSVPNLRAARQDAGDARDAGDAQLPHNKHSAISKPASMRELPRARLQAYVETEAESGEDKGGSCLLD